MVDIKGAIGANELTDKQSGLYRALLAEFLGTMLLNFFGCGSVVTKNVVAISLAFGLTVAAAIQSIGHVSGGHVNPAVTFGLMIIGKVPIIRGFLYVLAQSAGAIAGSAVLRALSTESMEVSLGVVSLADGVTPVQGLGIEFFLALILVMVVCGACDGAKPDSKGIAPLLIGLSVTVGHLVGVPRTGAGMNPARSLGSSVVMNAFNDHWLYWVGPILGGLAGGLIYTHAVGPAKKEEISTRQYATVAMEEKELQNLTGRKNVHPA
ncbi:aquaporin AQPAn.G-like isoform X1 [Vespa mandarinia]|uniref:aquaporin AQPAn.G-like isoform X1 n=1 Tax=Vespa mandarinia TaxID=7446 RepID=UPI0016117F51|nr:aquaporin AQPAn.G-like isoform X1 [Vespa mandarinia]XP_046835701.1 aquaporin AQPAn.G isoform X1 [Vespa crabro]XP_047365716.1 aquaporin AQPAn.G isoform X1 [Vespa velutina]